MRFDMVDKAIAFASLYHGDQMYGTLPYITHCLAVKDLLLDMGESNSDVLAAAILHDVLEDTAATIEDLGYEFGERVAVLVDLVTNVGTIENTFNRISTDIDAVKIKCADRLVNVRNRAKNKKYRAHHDMLLKYFAFPLMLCNQTDYQMILSMLRQISDILDET